MPHRSLSDIRVAGTVTFVLIIPSRLLRIPLRTDSCRLRRFTRTGSRCSLAFSGHSRLLARLSLPIHGLHFASLCACVALLRWLLVGGLAFDRLFVRGRLRLPCGLI